jgi:hypothetical protein
MDTTTSNAPTDEEWAVLNGISDRMEAVVGPWDSAALLYRATTNGAQHFEYRVHDERKARTALDAFLCSRQWRYRLSHDPDWEEARALWSSVNFESR